MTLSITRVFTDAGLLWRTQRDVLARIAAVFMFLPAFGVQLFVPRFVTEAQTREAVFEDMWTWYLDNAAWLGGAKLVEIFGTTLVLVLLLDAGQPTLRGALARAVRLAPLTIAAELIAGVAFGIGLTLFVIPGFYVAGRTYLAIAAIVSDAKPSPVRGIVRAIELSTGNGWKLFGLIMLVSVPMFSGWYLLAPLSIAADGSEALKAAVGAAGALISAIGALVMALVQASAYRALSPRQGI